MFGSKKKKIAELERQLREERSAHEEDKQALKELQSNIELEKNTFSELQDVQEGTVHPFGLREGVPAEKQV